MRLQSGYGLKESIRDERKLTLLLQWQYLNAKEAKEAIAQIGQVLGAVIGEQDMLFLNAISGRRKNSKRIVSWKPRATFELELKGFVRTEESVRKQKQRVKQALHRDFQQSLTEYTVCHNPLSPTTQEQAVSMAQDILTVETTDYVQHTYPVEMIFRIRQTYCANGTYRIESGITVSGYAIRYAIEEWVEKYKTCLKTVWQRTSLFGGYIFYETQPQGVHAYFHKHPIRVNGQLMEDFFLAGYEWAAFLSKELKEQLSKEEIEQLQQMADVSFENDGMFYQTRCDITKYSLAQKKRYAQLFQKILQPGYSYIPVYRIRGEKMQPVDCGTYLLKPRKDKTFWKEPPYYLGFYCKVTPELARTTVFYDVIEEIKIT